MYMLYIGLPLKIIWELQLVQNAAMGTLVAGFQMHFKVLNVIFKTLNGIGLITLSPSIPVHTVRSSRMDVHQVPSIIGLNGICHFMKSTKYTFSAAASSLWNNICPGIWMTPSFSGLWKSLKTWLWSHFWSLCVVGVVSFVLIVAVSPDCLLLFCFIYVLNCFNIMLYFVSHPESTGVDSYIKFNK